MLLFNDKARLRQSLRLLKDCIVSMRGSYVVFLLIIATAAGISLLPPQLYRFFFQSIEHKDANASLKIVMFGGIIAVCLFLTTILSTYAREWIRTKMETHLRQKVLRALCATSLSELEQISRGEWVACTSGDLIETEDFLTLSLPDQLKNLALFVGSSGLFLFYGGSIGAVLLITAIFLIVVNMAVQKRMQGAFSEIRSLHGSVYQQLLQNFEGLRTIRSFNGEAMVQNNFEDKLKSINKKSLLVMRKFSLLIGFNELSILFGIAATLAIISHKLNTGAISFDDALIYPFYMGVFFMSVTSFYRSNFDWTMFFTKGARLADLIYRFYRSHRSDEPIALHDDMFFSNIELRYPGYRLLAPPFDLQVEKNSLLGIIGPSGCGKSTLLEFLAGLRPLRIDGKSVQLSCALAAYVEQKPFIFEGSLRENLLFGAREKISDEKLHHVIRRVHLDELIKGDLDYCIKERGENLSEGEKYRIGIARAILTDKPFLLMDEPFSALDHRSIKAIVSMINEERRKRGVVIVTHYFPNDLTFDELLNFEALAEIKTNHLVAA